MFRAMVNSAWVKEEQNDISQGVEHSGMLITLCLRIELGYGYYDGNATEKDK